MTKKQTDDDLKAIRDLVSEEILSLSDAEIRARAKEENIDIDRNASTIRERLSTLVSNSRRTRLQQARENLNAVNQSSPPYGVSASMSFSDVRTRLAEIVASGMMAKDAQLTLAFRSGQDMSEEDMRSLLADLEVLLAKKQNEADEEK